MRLRVQCQHRWLLGEQITERALKLQMEEWKSLLLYGLLWQPYLVLPLFAGSSRTLSSLYLPLCSVPGTGSVLC